MRNAIFIVFLFAIGFAATQNTKAQLAKTPVTEPASVVRRMADVYVQSIVDADAKLGATVWSPTPDVSFIEPRGNEQGWEQISSVFYVKTMGEMFTKRHAKIQTTLDLYTQEDSDETRPALGEFLTAVGMNATVH
jgi:hypothetical protein